MPGSTALQRQLDSFCKGLDPRPDVGGRCPCGGLFAARKTDGHTWHSQPPCNTFEANEPDEYLRLVRVRYSE